MKTSAATPLCLMVAPNGARRTQADHPALPIRPAELAKTAAECLAAGAAAFHLHVRDNAGRHVLDAAAYRDATAAIRAAVGDRLVLQVTTEAVGQYSPDQQMALVRELRPEAVSLALAELLPAGAAEAPVAAFLNWLARERIRPQYILYSVKDVQRFHDLRARGVIPGAVPDVLFVLGRYKRDQQSKPRDLLPFVQAWNAAPGAWSVCAFGSLEAACMLTTMALGGHVRVGFENNLYRPDGTLLHDNAESVARIATVAPMAGRRLIDAHELRAGWE